MNSNPKIQATHHQIQIDEIAEKYVFIENTFR